MPSKSEKTRQRIVNAANQLFYRKGYNRTSFTDIVEGADVPRGNIYYYFKTKDEMLLAVVNHRLEVITGMLTRWESEIIQPIERLERFVQIMYDSTPALLRSGCPMGSLNIELAKDQPELKAESKKLFDLFLQWLTKQFVAIGYPTEARELALQLLSRGQGAIVVAQVYQDPGFLQRSTEDIKRWLVDLERYA
ncbi:MAG: TetR/AcrR family transcriptional regulator [Candidatus Sedimenticola sp. (ex Thyasira tokunagai)]